MRSTFRTKLLGVTALIFLLSTMLSGCLSILLSLTGGAGDWYFTLPNYYYVMHINNHDISVAKGEEDLIGGPTVLGPFVISFCYNQRYVGIEQLPIPEGTKDNTEIDQILEKSTAAEYRYYLIDTQTNEIYGPFLPEEYYQKCNEIGVNDFCEWINTDSITVDETWETYKAEAEKTG